MILAMSVFCINSAHWTENLVILRGLSIYLLFLFLLFSDHIILVSCLRVIVCDHIYMVPSPREMVRDHLNIFQINTSQVRSHQKIYKITSNKGKQKINSDYLKILEIWDEDLCRDHPSFREIQYGH